MSLIHFSGFEQGPGWTLEYVLTNSPPIATAAARTGTYGLHLNGASRGARYDFVSDAHATIITGFARNFDTSVPNTSLAAFYGDAAATTHITLAAGNSPNIINVYRGTTAGTVIGTANVSGLWNSWHYFEVKVVLHDTTGSVHIRQNGTEILALTNVDTKNAGTAATIDAVAVVNSQNTNAYVDDWYICNGAGSAPFNDFLGDCRVEPLRPNGNGTYSQLVGSDGNSTDNYLLVDETNPSMTDYNGSATPGDKDSYALANLASTAVTVYGVRVNTLAAKSDAGSINGRTTIRTNSTDYSSSDHALSTSAISFLSNWYLNPNTGVAWTPSEINALEAGFEVRT